MRDVMLILHFIGLAMGLGTSFANMYLGRAASRLSPEEAVRFGLHTLALGRMGHIGLTLLVVSGIFLMGPYWSVLATSPLLIAKLVLVLVLGALIGIITSRGKKARQGDAPAQFRKIAPLGRLALLTGLVIVALAVYFFR
jgi:uncharacterized membrane protein SirB2